MAEIEFKRRGTPLWAVVLVLIVIAGIVWALVGRGRPAAVPADTTAAADSTAAGAVAPMDSAHQAAAAKAPAPVTAPASSVGPAVRFAAWVDTTKAPASADQQPAHIGQGIQLLADALQERVPLAGAQVMMLRAMADTLMMPNLKASQYTNATQAAFFGAAYALRRTSAEVPLNDKATVISLTKPLSQQSREVQSFFTTAAKVLREPIAKQPVTPPPAVAPANSAVVNPQKTTTPPPAAPVKTP
jgi:hypothetical protein